MSKFFRKFIKKIKGPWPETSTGARMNPRTSLICGGLALVVMGLAAARVTYSLYDIQIKNGDTYRQLAAKQQLLDTTIKATRGEIYDTSGITLASTSVVWTIWADPDNSKILYTTTGKDEEAVRTLDTAMCAEVSRELTLRLLSGDGESLDAVDTSSEAYQTQYQKVYDALSKTDTKYQVLATKANNAVKLSIESYVSQFNKAHKRATETSRKGNISVGSEKSFQRNYPYGAFAAAVLGFTDADGIGTYGLEKSYQSTLAGVDGRTITQRNAYGNAIADENATTFAAKDGSNLVLSLDVNVQEIVERYLNEAIAANTVENRGCAIVMNVKTGAILAMASKPDFDPNDPLDYSANLDYLNELVRAEPELYGIYKKDENGNELKDANGNRILDEEGDYSGYFRDIQWKNKAITELYYPGSVFKVITSAMGVDSGLANINTTFTCAGLTAWQRRPTTAQATKPTAPSHWPKLCGRAAISTISSWASALAPRPSITTSMPLALPAAPAWICPVRRASCSIIRPTSWAKCSWLPRPLVRQWPSPRCRCAPLWPQPSTAAIWSRPMWWIRSPMQMAT